MIETYVGKDYPHVCLDCQAAIDACVTVAELGPDTDDPEAPIMLAGDEGMMCGGHRCNADLIGERNSRLSTPPRRWSFYVIGWESGKGPIHTHVEDSNQGWPLPRFEELAEEKGYTRIVRNQTIVGGYFVHPDTGDVLICLPSGVDPLEF